MRLEEYKSGLGSNLKISMYAFLATCLIVGGCNTTYTQTSGEPPGTTPVKVARSFPPVKPKPPAEPYDPIKEHMKARLRVDPSDTRPEHAYTRKTVPKEILGPDIRYVKQVKPPPEERVTKETILAMREEEGQWFGGLFSDNALPEQAEDFALSNAEPIDFSAEPMGNESPSDEKPRPEIKAKPEDEQPDADEAAVIKKTPDRDKPVPDEKIEVARASSTPKKEPARRAPPPTKIPVEPEEQPAINKEPEQIAVKEKTFNPAMTVTSLRVGQHPDKTRMVLDLTAEPNFSYQVQEDKNLLIVNLPKAEWKTDAKKVYAQHPLILAYIAKDAPDGGTILAIKLRKKVKVLKDAIFRPSKNAGHRIVFDIAEK